MMTPTPRLRVPIEVNRLNGFFYSLSEDPGGDIYMELRRRSNDGDPEFRFLPTEKVDLRDSYRQPTASEFVREFGVPPNRGRRSPETGLFNRFVSA
jgi:hypothetical protein